MNPTRNPVTGDFMISSPASDSYRDGWDRIFGNKEKTEVKTDELKKVEDKKVFEPALIKKEKVGERTILHLDVGNISDAEAIEFLQLVKEEFLKTKYP